MKCVSVFCLLSSLVAVLVFSEVCYAADSGEDENSIGVTLAAEDKSEEGEEGENTDDASIVVTRSYSAAVSDPQWKGGRCQKEVTVKGPGIDDVIPIDCVSENFVFTNNTMLVVDGALYSNAPNTMVVVKGGLCEKRTYSEPSSTPATARMTPQECAAVRRSMVQVRREVDSRMSALSTGLQNGLLGGSAGSLPSAGGDSASNFFNNFRLGL